MLYPFLFLFIIGLMLPSTTDACGKRPVRPTPTPTTIATNTSEGTTPQSSYRLPCNATEERLLSCLHGGSCFIVIIKKERNRNCQCPQERTGFRCQELSPEFFQPIIDPNKLRTAHIAAGVVGTVIIVLVIVLSAYVYRRVKKKESSLAHRQRQNGANGSHPNNASNSGPMPYELQPINKEHGAGESV
ncbi:pro-neuregulin-1, membrane-bound isoform-like isoform X2 [Liolophura sinensis]|uniref:pro-neuregulin-1, membrane-bound isoform-like isoform X2 n=1 Tax=Liolophura sinensis TaxID=3198878 RepID=UPI0031591F57